MLIHSVSLGCNAYGDYSIYLEIPGAISRESHAACYTSRKKQLHLKYYQIKGKTTCVNTLQSAQSAFQSPGKLRSIYLALKAMARNLLRIVWVV
jgi:hypothetical protein